VSLRRRLSIIAAASVGLAVLLAILVGYMVVRSQLYDQIDSELTQQAQAVQNGNYRFGRQLPGAPARAGGSAQYAQGIVGGVAAPQLLQGGLTLPITGQMRRIAAAGSGSTTLTTWVGGAHLRIFAFGETIPAGGFGSTVNVAIELARPLNGLDSVLATVRVVFALLLLGGMALAVVLGRIASRRVLAPLNEVARAAEHIARTDDLSSRLRVHADDEVGQLATRFNTMLDRLQRSRAALDDSVRAQRQLVADASHELRTPVTSLRTNIEVLLEGGVIDEEDRRRLLADVVEQSEELSALVGDLIELARGDQPGPETDDVRLDTVLVESLARARRNSPGIRFDAELVPVLIDGVPERLGRAINNLLDNAARHSPPDGTVEVSVTPDRIEVRDHGPGVEPEDQPYVFDRFFRGRNSRGRQGSGLGLAIVRQVTEQHGGTASVHNAPDGGAVFTLHLPGVPAVTGPGEAFEELSAAPPEPADQVRSGRATRA
jgi:two-component system sensor histidine kinase MprB